MAGREVLLYVNREVIEAIGGGNGVGLQDFIEAVKEGPSYTWEGNVCEKAFSLFKHFRTVPKEHPPYIAYLALFVYAATIEGDFDGKAYYPRLYEALGEPRVTGSYPGFERMHFLWEDLERWSKEDKGEELGRFTFRRRGGWVNVGIPLSQLILSEEERAYLPQIFYQASIDPADPPPDLVLKRTLFIHGGKLLRGRTRKLLDSESADDRELLAALLDFVLEELEDWDCTVPEEGEDVEKHRRLTSARQMTAVGLRICIETEDTFLRTATYCLRVKTNQQIPEDGLLLEYEGTTYTCKEANEPSWTTRLRENSSSPPFDPSRLDWITGAIFEDRRNNWVARLRGTPVRLFMQRPLESISGWIECSQLAYNSEFIVACHQDYTNKVETWGETCALRRIDVAGLPADWTLYMGKDVKESCPGVDVLTLPKQFHLYLQGGLKTGRGNEYLHFATPTVEITGGTGQEGVALNGQVLEPIAGTCCWRFPPQTSAHTTLEIQVFDTESKDVLERRFVRLTEPSISANLEANFAVDKFGRVTPASDMSNKTPYVIGAVVYGNYREEPYVTEEPLPFYLSHRIVFIGSRPGEVFDWPAQDSAVNWQPVWALAKKGRDKWAVHYCGSEGGDAPPLKPSALHQRKAVKKWREAVWINRKKNVKPKIKLLASLWQSYVEVAKLV
jgi:hypothetical protein